VNCTYTNLLNFDTTYYWKIVAWDEHGLKTSGPIWFFTTEENLPPIFPNNPIPEDGEPRVPIDLEFLLWNCSDPNPCDTLLYDVYFDDISPPDLASLKQKENYWRIPYQLTLYKTYYWKIVAWDSGGLSTEGPIWSFTTGGPCTPFVIINGPTHGSVGVAYTYTFNSTDECGNDLFIMVDWGDGTQSEWMGPYASGVEINDTHTWYKVGLYIIKARAIDIFGYAGPWSEHPITIPRNKEIYNSILLKFLENYPVFQQFLRNFLVYYN
jgi:hypothetical protein